MYTNMSLSPLTQATGLAKPRIGLVKTPVKPSLTETQATLTTLYKRLRRGVTLQNKPKAKLYEKAI
jgi:hypothetical protein